ncbi:MAG: prolipoprotein diacylglyceryl transferase [Alphaproteobacteria bacterium]
MFAIAFPVIDPIAISIGGFAVRWYALAYMAGILCGWRWAAHMARQQDGTVKPQHVDDIVIWITLGIVLGGRVGYVLFYKPAYFFSHPLEIPMMWQGGMSFHGGMLGVFLAMFLYARQQGFSFFSLSDIIGASVPFGLFFGRIANFINGELWGRPADVPWAMVFPGAGSLPRHPSQLYEATLEGILLFLVLYIAWKQGLWRRTGALSGVFMIAYGSFRFLIEFTRQPDAHLGLLWGGVSMGQLLSFPMILIGIYLLIWSRQVDSRHSKSGRLKSRA